jgi:hypothetical protein
MLVKLTNVRVTVDSAANISFGHQRLMGDIANSNGIFVGNVGRSCKLHIYHTL